jgi:hypothetical protein
VAEPMLFVELNVIKWVRVCVGGGYRYVEGVDGSRVNLNSCDLRGASAELQLKFGFF